MKDTTDTLPKSPTELTMRIGLAERGDWIAYHRGGTLRLTESGGDIANRAWTEYMAGTVTLVQRRLSHGRFSEFEYIAVKL